MNNETILSAFKSQYGYLSKFGLEIHGIANLIDDYDVIRVTHPFIFDHRLLPRTFMGLEIRGGINHLPKEFQVDNVTEYVWAYQRFENFVDNHADEIRRALHNATLTRTGMLDALCFGDFESHKRCCIGWEEGGVIPQWSAKRKDE